jgi:hypothetical protein
MIAPEDRDRARATTRRRLAGESIKNVEYTAQRRDGSQFPVIVDASPIQRGKQLTGLRGLVLDITERNASPADAFFQLLQQAETACFRAKDITQQLLTFSRGGEPVKKIIETE